MSMKQQYVNLLQYLVPFVLLNSNASTMPMCRLLQYASVSAALVALLLAATGYSVARARNQFAARSLAPTSMSTPGPEPLKFPDTALEPIDWNALDGWATDDHAAAFATFLSKLPPSASDQSGRSARDAPYVLRPDARVPPGGCGWSAHRGQARVFFERNFRPLRIAKLGDSAGFLTGYYEPIVDGSRFPTGIFKVPIYRRPRDLVPPLNSTGPGFPNRGQSLRRTRQRRTRALLRSRRDPRRRPRRPAS